MSAAIRVTRLRFTPITPTATAVLPGDGGVATADQPVALRRSPPRLEWPLDGSIDVDVLQASGWRPAPFAQYLFKVASRCNLDCDYCYVYHLADSSWKAKPPVMPMSVVATALERIRDHIDAHALDKVSLVLHGGEPLLVGATYIKEFVERARGMLGDTCELRFTIQSNGTLVTPELLDALDGAGVVVGVSLDGDRSGNDLHRRDKRGRSSYDRVARGIALLREPHWAHLLSGLLCTINLESNPHDVYDGLLRFEPPWIDFLLPHGTWSAPPPGLAPGDGETPYADWLIPIFDHWFSQSTKTVSIRIFEEIVSLTLGGRSRYESFGVSMVNLVVVESDGTLEQVDSLKAAYDGAAVTGLNVFDNSFDDALMNPAVVARQIGIDGLCEECRACRLATSCGGGLYPHRYRLGSGFLNPSVYCADLMKLIDHVSERVHREMTRRTRLRDS